jgi:hypothetical protein
MGLSSNGKDADRDGGIIAANFGGVWHFNRERSAMPWARAQATDCAARLIL